MAHSAEVRIRLTVDGRDFNVSHLGPEFVMLRNAIDLPPAEGEIEMSIDGKIERWRVALPDGIAPEVRKTRIVAVRERQKRANDSGETR